jgi:hypothetical protein
VIDRDLVDRLAEHRTLSAVPRTELDIARRLVRHNDGAIDFESHPGRTEFRVRIPLAEIRPAGAAH